MDSEQPVERFRPSTGMYVGWSSLAAVVVVLGYAAVRLHTVVGLRVVLGALFAGVLVWATQIRPRLTAYPETLRMHGIIRDVHVPYVLVDKVSLGQTLDVWVGERRFVCVGIGRTVSAQARRRVSGLRERTDRFPELTYESFVAKRVEDLVRAARSRSGRPSTPAPGVRTSYAVPEILALVLTGVAFAVSLLA